MSDLQTVVEQAFENRAEINPRNVDTHVKEAVVDVISQLDSGKIRVA